MALRALFDEVDTDKSGFITINEVKDLVRRAGYSDSLSDRELEALFQACDDNGDGRISFEEFVNHMCG